MMLHFVSALGEDILHMTALIQQVKYDAVSSCWGVLGAPCADSRLVLPAAHNPWQCTAVATQ